MMQNHQKGMLVEKFSFEAESMISNARLLGRFMTSSAGTWFSCWSFTVALISSKKQYVCQLLKLVDFKIR